MASLIVTTENQQQLEGGKVGYGSCTVWTKYGETSLYEIRLSAKAASMVSEGDTIEWGRGQSYGPVQDCTDPSCRPFHHSIVSPSSTIEAAFADSLIS